jgi:hypothetical protein
MILMKKAIVLVNVGFGEYNGPNGTNAIPAVLVLLVVATSLHPVGVGVIHAVNVHFSVLVVVAVKYRNASLLRFSTAAVIVT